MIYMDTEIDNWEITGRNGIYRISTGLSKFLQSNRGLNTGKANSFL